MHPVNNTIAYPALQGIRNQNPYLSPPENTQTSTGTPQLEGIRAQLRKFECDMELNKLVMERLCVHNAALEGRVLAQEERMGHLEERVSKELGKNTHFSGNLEKDSQTLEKDTEENLVNMKKMKLLEERVLAHKGVICKLYQHVYVLESQVKVSRDSERAIMGNLASMQNEMWLLKEEMKRVNSFSSLVSSDVNKIKEVFKGSSRS